MAEQRGVHWIRELNLALRDFYGDNCRRPHAIVVHPEIMYHMQKADTALHWFEVMPDGTVEFARLPITEDKTVKTFRLEK